MSLGSRGRGRGALSLLRTPGDGSTGQQGGSGYKLMEARVTEIVDVDSFWAQIGTASDLEKFDQLCVSLSTWCQEHGGEGMKTLPKVKEVVAVRQQRKKKGGEGGEEEEVEETWARAMVSRQVSDIEIEVFFIDSGVSGRVGLGEVCSASSSLLYSSPAQALHCYLQGVELPDGEEEWPDDVVSQFSELVRYPTEVKAIVDKVEAGGSWFSVTLYVMYDGSWTSVGEILAEENKAKYSPLAPVYADNLVAAMATATTVSDDTAQQNSPDQTAEEGVLGEGLELMQDMPPLTGVDDHQPTSEEEARHKPENMGPITPPLDPAEKQLFFSKPVEVAIVETAAGGEVAVAEESGAGERRKEGVVEDNGVEEGGTPVVGFSRDGGSETREIPAVPSREQSEDPSLSTASTMTTNSSDQQESKPPATIVPTSVDPGNQEGSKVKPPPANTSKGRYNYNQRWRAESHSPLSSDDEWDESLLPPRQQFYSGSSESTPQISPLKKNNVSSSIHGDSAQSRKRAHFRAQLETLMADGNDSSASGPAKQQGRWPFFRRQEDGGGEGLLEGEGGGQGIRKVDQPPRRGRLRGGGRGQTRSDHTQSDYEGRPGGMRGVRMRGGGRGGRGGDRQGQRFYERFGKRDLLDSDSKQGPPLSQQPTELREIGGMTSDEMKNETEWHSWRLKQKIAKILEVLSPATMHSFGAEVQSLLADSSAQKLISLPMSKGPLMVILTCTISDSIKKPDKLDLFVQAVEQIHSVTGTNLHQLLQPALEGISHDICESLTASSDLRRARHAFSSFLGKLFISSNYTRDEKYNAAIGHAVRHFLNMWSRCSHQQMGWKSTAYADCFAALCEEIGPPMDATSKETLDEYFDGAVLENILSDKLPRSAKEIFLKVALKRASKWEGTSAKLSAESPTPHTTQASVQMIPSFSEKAPPPTANVVHPIPVSVSGIRTGVQAGGLDGMGIGHGRNIPHTYQQQQLSQIQVQQIQVQQQTQQQMQQQMQQQLQQQISPQHLQQQIQQQAQQQISPRQLHLQQQAQRDAVHYQIAQTDPPQSAFISPPARTHPPQYAPPQPMSEQDQYAQVAEMLSSLGFPELLEKFKSVMFKDSIVFDCESEQLKTGLKEAGVPAGAITGILHYREKVKRKTAIGQRSSHSSTPVYPPSTPIQPQPPTPLQLQQSTPLSPPYQVHVGTIPSQGIVPHDHQGDVYGIGSPPSAYQPSHPQDAAAYTLPGGGGPFQYPPIVPSTSQPGMTMQLPCDSSNSSLTARPMQLPADNSLAGRPMQLPADNSLAGRPMQLPADNSLAGRPMQLPADNSLAGRPMQLPADNSLAGRPMQLPADNSLAGRPMQLPADNSLAGRPMQLPADNSLAGRPMQLPADNSLAGRPMQLPRHTSGSERPPVMTMALSNTGNSDSSPLAGKEQQKWGFGKISCVVCGSRTHKTEVCTERGSKFFFS